MAAMNNELFQSALHFFQNTQSIFDLLKALPEQAQIAVKIDQRTDATLQLLENSVSFTEGAAHDADILIEIGPETLRRWQKNPPGEVTQLALSFISEITLGQCKIKNLKPFSVLKEKGYVKTLEALGPKVQSELMQKGLIALSTAQSTLQMGVATAKTLAKSFFEDRFKK